MRRKKFCIAILLYFCFPAFSLPKSVLIIPFTYSLNKKNIFDLNVKSIFKNENLAQYVFDESDSEKLIHQIYINHALVRMDFNGQLLIVVFINCLYLIAKTNLR